MSLRSNSAVMALAVGLLSAASASGQPVDKGAGAARPGAAPAAPAPKPDEPSKDAPKEAAKDAPKDATKDATKDAPAETKPAEADAKDEPLVPPAATNVAGEAPPPAMPLPDPERDKRALARQGSERPGPAGSATPTGDVGVRPSDVFAEDWWSQARPSFEIHGLFRVRSELFHHFALGRRDPLATSLWMQPPDTSYTPTSGEEQRVRLCGDDPTNLVACDNHTQAGANMRFRLSPELHISDNLRILSQIDILDNVVLGSTPDGYTNTPSSGGGYTLTEPGGYSSLGAFRQTTWAPSAGQTSITDSLVVKRVWGEYVTPVGVLRFGRMPNQWGLGMLNNEGNGYDSDWQSTVDRIMFVTGIKKYDLYFAGAWDFVHEGATSATTREQQGQPYDLGQLDDVSQYVMMLARRRPMELSRLDLAAGLPVINGGVYFAYRNQVLANDTTDPTTSATLGQSPTNIRLGYTRRGAEFFTPDLWFQFLYKKFRFEAEAAMVYGTIENLKTVGQPGGGVASSPVADVNPLNTSDIGWKVQSFGVAAQSEFRALDDKLRLDFGFGWASGDPDSLSLTGAKNGVETQTAGNRTYSTFRFHPDYRIDLILWRNILQRVQGAYYFRPSVQYDFAKDQNGQRLGGSAAIIWSRASEFIQTPGNKRDLGIEADFTLYFQAKDGSLNDRPDQMGGFYTALQYGVLFPLGGLGYLPGEITQYAADHPTSTQLDTETAQTLRWYLGIMF